MAALVAQGMLAGSSFAARAGGATSPTLGPGPVVYQFEIQRTTEPLSPYNVLPPPLPLNEVLRMKGAQPTSGPLFDVRRMSAVSGPSTGVLSAVPPPFPAVPELAGRTSSTLLAAKAAPAKGTAPSGKGPGIPVVPSREEVLRATAAAAAAPGTPVRITRPTPTPAPPREYPDRLVLGKNDAVSCLILGEVGTSLRVELDNGVVVNIPKQRILSFTRKSPSP